MYYTILYMDINMDNNTEILKITINSNNFIIDDLQNIIEYQGDFYHGIKNYKDINIINLIITYDKFDFHIYPVKHNDKYILIFDYQHDNGNKHNNIIIKGTYLKCDNIQLVIAYFKSQCSSFNSDGFIWLDDYERYNVDGFEIYDNYEKYKKYENYNN